MLYKINSYKLKASPPAEIGNWQKPEEEVKQPGAAMGGRLGKWRAECHERQLTANQFREPYTIHMRVLRRYPFDNVTGDLSSLRTS